MESSTKKLLQLALAVDFETWQSHRTNVIVGLLSRSFWLKNQLTRFPASKLLQAELDQSHTSLTSSTTAISTIEKHNA